ncbi:MAG: thermonuclease family protein [Pseudomonadales bacterium]
MNKTVWGVIAVVAAFLALQLFAAPEQPLADEPFSGRVRYVVDGDSLYVEGVEPQIRLWGINAPERDEPGHEQATKTLRKLVLQKPITCYRQGTDKFGRTVARCETKAGKDISQEMLDSGKASEYCWFSKGFYGTC